MVFIVNAVINAVLFGLLVEQSEVLGKMQNEYQERVDRANTTLHDLDISEDLRHNVRRFIATTHYSQCKQKELQVFMKNLRPGVQFMIKLKIYGEIMAEEPNIQATRLALRSNGRITQYAINKMRENEIKLSMILKQQSQQSVSTLPKLTPTNEEVSIL